MIANLPSKVLSPQSQLNRTGIYFGFARVLPQDPDDPDLVNNDEELDSDPIPASGSNGQVAIERSRANDDDDGNNDDPRDDEWEVDEEEVVLAASPTSTEAEGSTHSSLAPARIKSRQLSKSSTRSNTRNATATLMEQVTLQSDQSSLDVHSPSSKSGSRLVATATSNDSPLAMPEKSQNDAKPSISPIDIQNATTSSSSSNAGSLRRRKKRRVQIAEADQRVFPMVMSVGWNPFYKNTTKTAEVHIMHPFEADLYGLEMRVVVLGYLRPELNYVSKEALIEDIEMDKRVAINSLARTLYQDYSTDPFLLSS